MDQRPALLEKNHGLVARDAAGAAGAALELCDTGGRAASSAWTVSRSVDARYPSGLAEVEFCVPVRVEIRTIELQVEGVAFGE